VSKDIDIFEHPEVLELTESPIRPSLTEIGPLAKKFNITSVQKLWDFFDKIQKLWSENKNH
jgi:hypothetical protein